MKRFLGLAILWCAVFGAQGCTSSGPTHPTGKLSGKITLKNEDVLIGTVWAVPDDSKIPKAGGIVKDGAYSIDKAPAGKVTIRFEIPGYDLADIIKDKEFEIKFGKDAKDKGEKRNTEKDKQPAAPKGNPAEADWTEAQKKQKYALADVLYRSAMQKSMGRITTTVEAGKDNPLDIDLSKY